MPSTRHFSLMLLTVGTTAEERGRYAGLTRGFSLARKLTLMQLETAYRCGSFYELAFNDRGWAVSGLSASGHAKAR